MDAVLASYKDFDFENIIGTGYSEELERTGLKEKTRALLKEAYSYSSEDADINRYHNQFIRVCEDLCEFYTAIEVYSQFESTMMPTSGVEDVTITLQLANVSNLGMEVLRVKTNLENNIIIYEEMRSEMFKKYGINENKYLF